MVLLFRQKELIYLEPLHHSKEYMFLGCQEVQPACTKGGCGHDVLPNAISGTAMWF